jgi:hypothetical protein
MVEQTAQLIDRLQVQVNLLTENLIDANKRIDCLERDRLDTWTYIESLQKTTTIIGNLVNGKD